MKKKMLPWKMRNLSMQGKVHIVKSLGLSKILYGSEMITVENEYIQTSMDMVWEYIWEGKKVYVPKVVCMLPRSEGGLGIPDLKSVVKVMRVKMLISVLKSNVNDTWSMLAKQYMKCLDKKYGIEFFALRVDDATNDLQQVSIPDYYKECMLFFQELCRKGKRVHSENEILWCNSKFQFKGQPFNFKHWSTCGIQFLSDVINDGQIDENKIKTLVKRKAGLMFEYFSFKKSFPDEWLSYSTGTPTKTDFDIDRLLNLEFVVPKVGSKTLLNLTSSDMYKIFMFSEPYTCRSENYWKTKFETIDIDFHTWFSCMFISKIIPRKSIDFNWRIFHGQINTEKKLKAMNFSNGICSLCKYKEENLDHLLIDCEQVQNIWQQIECILSRIANATATNLIFTRFNMMVGYLENGYRYELMNMVLSITRWIIWKRRCMKKYDKNMISLYEMELWIKREICDHVDILLVTSTNKNIELLKLIKNSIQVI